MIRKSITRSGETAPPEGTPVNNPSGGGDGDGGGGGKAVFPLPEEYQGDFSNDWGAARPGGQGHEGTDIFAPDGTAIHSITKGKVVPVAGSNESGWNELGGWTVMIEASEGHRPHKEGRPTLLRAHGRASLGKTRRTP